MKKLHLILLLLSPVLLVLTLMVSPFFILHNLVNENKPEAKLT